MSLSKIVRSNINKAMDAKGITGKSVADCLNVSKSAVSQYRNNKRGISIDQLEAIARHIGVPVSSLLETNDGPKT